jgi:hypothetical protein
MAVTIEQNQAIKKAIRNDLRYIVPGVPTRYFYKRGPWSPRSVVEVEYIGAAVEGGEEVTPVSPGVPVEGFEYSIINIATAATHVIVEAIAGRKILISFLTWTVGGEVNITLYEGANPISGAMDFGGASEPRGIVMHPDAGYLELDEGKAFRILLSAAVQVSGFLLYRYA